LVIFDVLLRDDLFEVVFAGVVRLVRGGVGRAMRDDEAGVTGCMAEWSEKCDGVGKIEMVDGEG
jgi:hypothetical protein